MSPPFSFAVLYKRSKKADIIFLLKCLIRFKRNPSGLAFLFYYYFLMESYSLLVQYSSVSLSCFLLFSCYVLKINIQIDTKFWSLLVTYILIFFNFNLHSRVPEFSPTPPAISLTSPSVLPLPLPWPSSISFSSSWSPSSFPQALFYSDDSIFFLTTEFNYCSFHEHVGCSLFARTWTT